MLRTLIFLVLFLPNILFAQVTDYGSVKLLKGWKLPDGSFQMALEFDLNPGWKTYWRAPGSGGLPPLMEWNGSSNIADVTISWPRPFVFETAGILSVGYSGKTILPIRITPAIDGPVRVALSLQFGVCSDICIPAEAAFLARLSGQSEEGKAAIQAALAQVPESASAAGLRDISCQIVPTGDSFELTAEINFQRGFDDPFVIIEYDSNDIWITETTTSTSGRKLVTQAGLNYYGTGPMILNRNDIRVSIFEGDRAVEIDGCPS